MTRGATTTEVIDYDGAEDVAALTWFDARASAVVRPETSRSTVKVAFRTLDQIDAPLRDKQTWALLCKEVEGSPLHQGFIEMGPR